jgi:hypothetical protein
MSLLALKLFTNIWCQRQLVHVSVKLASWEESVWPYGDAVQAGHFADQTQNHPISDLPAFFIHPCNTAEALEETCQDRSCSPEVYLLVWFGLIGPSVNLYVPSQLLLGDAEDKAQAP